MPVKDDLWDHSVCWIKSGIVWASGKQGVHNLINIAGTSTSVGDIWSRLRSGGNDHGADAEAAALGRKN